MIREFSGDGSVIEFHHDSCLSKWFRYTGWNLLLLRFTFWLITLNYLLLIFAWIIMTTFDDFHGISVDTWDILGTTLKCHHSTVGRFGRSTPLCCLNLRLNDESLAFQHLQFAQKCILKLDEMVDLFDSRELKPWVQDLVDVVELHQVTRSRKLNVSDLFFRQTILESISLNKDLLFLRSELATLVDQETKLSDALLCFISQLMLPASSCCPLQSYRHSREAP